MTVTVLIAQKATQEKNGSGNWPMSNIFEKKPKNQRKYTKKLKAFAK
jgi:hypothetical protein